jgi:hypothetical protein
MRTFLPCTLLDNCIMMWGSGLEDSKQRSVRKFQITLDHPPNCSLFHVSPIEQCSRNQYRDQLNAI